MNWWAKWVEAVEEAWVFIFTNKNDTKEPTVTPYPNPFIQVIPKPATPPMNPDTLLPWNTTASLSHENWHNVRVLCDLGGLTFNEKEILTACVWQESWFMTNPKPNQNKLHDGTVWSTDFGIVQVNDYYNIGAGKPFPSVQYVLDNPEACVKWMVGIMKNTGRLQPWASYTTGVYKTHLGKTL